MRKLIVIFALLSACNLRPDKVEKSEYYSINTLIDQVLPATIRMNPIVNKSMDMNGSTETQEFQMDSTSWIKEMELFRGTDITKPAYSGLYTRSDNLKDDYSNLAFDQYSLTNPDSKSVVKVLRVYYLDSPDEIKKVEIDYADNNELFKSARKLQLRVDDIEGVPVLKSYTVDGFQQLALQDSVTYTIDVTLSY